MLYLQRNSCKISSSSSTSTVMHSNVVGIKEDYRIFQLIDIYTWRNSFTWQHSVILISSQYLT